MRYTVIVPNMTFKKQFEIYDWHNEVNIPYYPSIDEYMHGARYCFEDRSEAMHFKLRFGGTVVENDT